MLFFNGTAFINAGSKDSSSLQASQNCPDAHHQLRWDHLCHNPVNRTYNPRSGYRKPKPGIHQRMDCYGMNFG